MNTYALLRAGGKPTAEESMKNYDGNICRCTGYRNLVQAWVKVSGMEESG
jgi:aerobic-type carbon monoxide dehydrogenase small subunit (CoxS/CutS family)